MKKHSVPEHVYDHLKKDETMKIIMDRCIIEPVTQKGDVYSSLLRSITSQQLSTRVAEVIFGRFIEAFNGKIPAPSQLKIYSVEELRKFGYSERKAEYLRGVAQFFHESGFGEDYWDRPEDEILKELTSIRGVGVWTVQMILIGTLGKGDVFPVDDLGIQKSMAKYYRIGVEGKELKMEMEKISEGWRPFRSWASRYLWSALDQQWTNA